MDLLDVASLLCVSHREAQHCPKFVTFLAPGFSRSLAGSTEMLTRGLLGLPFLIRIYISKNLVVSRLGEAQ